MIPVLDPDRESYFQPFGDSGFGSSKKWNRNTSTPHCLTHQPLFVGVPEAEGDEVDVVGLLLVDGAGVDGLRQELVDAVRRHQRRTLHPLAAQLEAVRHLHL